MAQADRQHTLREWSLTDYHRYVRITLGCGTNVALCEMERRIVSGGLLLIPNDGAVEIDRFDFLSNYILQLDSNDRVQVVTRRPAAGLLPGGITAIKFDPSDPKSPVRIGPGRVLDGHYTVIERPPRPHASQTAPDRQPRRKPGQTRDAAIKKRLDNGERPGSDVAWKKFCDVIRTECHAFKGDPKNQEFKRGFSDSQIKRVTSTLMESFPHQA
jgi:hypothetical protein